MNKKIWGHNKETLKRQTQSKLDQKRMSEKADAGQSKCVNKSEDKDWFYKSTQAGKLPNRKCGSEKVMAEEEISEVGQPPRH